MTTVTEVDEVVAVAVEADAEADAVADVVAAKGEVKEDEATSPTISKVVVMKNKIKADNLVKADRPVLETPKVSDLNPYLTLFY